MPGWRPPPYSLLTTASTFVFLANTDLVPEADTPRTWEALLDPRWKGKFGTWVRAEGFVSLAANWGPDRVTEYIRKLDEQQPFLFPSTFPLAQQVGAGEVAVAFGIYHAAQPAITRGAPIRVTVPEPAPLSSLFSFIPSAGRNKPGGTLLALWLATPDGTVHGAVPGPDLPGVREGQYLHGSEGDLHEVGAELSDRDAEAWHVGPALPLRRPEAGRRGHGGAAHARLRQFRAGMVIPALIFDCDGVLADTERDGHRPAFNAMFEELHIPAHWDEREYGEKLRIGGGKERMASLFEDPEFARRFDVPSGQDARAALLATWHQAKGAHFRRLVADGTVQPRPGVTRIITAAVQAGWTVAVASTSARPSVQAVLAAAVGDDLADAIPIFAGDDVSAKKPDPAIYRLAVSSLGLSADQVLVVEDSRNGLRAAVGAGLRCVVTTSSYTRNEDFSEACLVVASLGDPGGPPSEVLADRTGVSVGNFISLDDLRACIGSAPPASGHPTEGDSA